jgi:hypothetical protein
MERALDFAGYDVRHIWGAGTHNGNQAQSVFPDAMRWLWRDWPNPIVAKEPGNAQLKNILAPNEGWHVVAEGCPSTASVASNPNGEIFLPCQRTANQGKGYISNLGMTIRSNGDVYTTSGNEVWLTRANGEKLQLAHGLKDPSGIALSPDGLWLFVAQRSSRWGISYRVKSDGTLDAGEPFYDFSVPGSSDESGAESVWMDRSGLAYVATLMGVQIFDRNGRVVGILPMPGNQPAASLCFGGKDFDTLFVLSGGKVYKRKLHSVGAPPWNPPITLPRWGAG